MNIWTLICLLFLSPLLFAADEEHPTLIKGVRLSDARYAHMRHHLGTGLGQQLLHKIVHKGCPYEGASLPESLEAAYGFLKGLENSGRLNHDKRKKLNARVGMAQLLANRGFVPSNRTTRAFYDRVHESLNHMWQERQNRYSPEQLREAGVERPNRSLYFTGAWLAAIKADLFERGFQSTETLDLQGAWEILSAIRQENLSSSKVIFLFKAGVLLKGQDHGFNPFNTEDERQQALEAYFASYVSVSEGSHGAHHHGYREPSKTFGHVRPKTTFRSDQAGDNLYARIRTYLQAEADMEGGNEADRSDQSDHNGDPSDDERMSPPNSPPGTGVDSAPDFDFPDPQQSDRDDDSEEKGHHAPHLPLDPAQNPSTIADADDDMRDEDVCPTTTDQSAEPIALDTHVSLDTEESEEEIVRPSNNKGKGRTATVLESSDEESEDEDTTVTDSTAQPAAAAAASGGGPLKKAKRAFLNRQDQTARDRRIKDLKDQGLSHTQVAAALQDEYPGTTKSIVSNAVTRLGLSAPDNKANRLTAAQKQQIAQLYEQATQGGQVPKYDEIQETVGCSRKQVERTIINYRVASGTAQKRRSKAEIEALRSRIIEAYKQQQEEGRVDIQEIADRFEVAATYVSAKVINPAVKQGVVRTTEARFSDEEIENLRALIEKQGVPHHKRLSQDIDEKIAKAYNDTYGTSTMRAWRVKKERLAMHTQLYGKRGNNHLSPEAREFLKKMIQGSPHLSAATIAQQFNEENTFGAHTTANNIDAHRKKLQKQAEQ